MTSRPAAPFVKVDPELLIYWRSLPTPSNEFLACDIIESLQRQIELAQTEIKGHMRVEDELREEIAGLQQGAVFCDRCAFRYGAEHKLADGTYSCPVCELVQAQTRIAEILQDQLKFTQKILQLEKDAARYRWLRNPPPGEHERLAVCGPEEAYFEERLDAAIDAALKSRA